MTLTHERLLEVLDCDPVAGVLTNRREIAGRAKGYVAGSLSKGGYVSTKVDGKRYALHRLIWFHVHGEWPKGPIDHINGDRADNRLCNLRDVTPSINAENLRNAKSHNKLGVLGIAEKHGSFYARIASRGKTICLGTFKTQEEAHAAYVGAKKVLHAGSTI